MTTLGLGFFLEHWNGRLVVKTWLKIITHKKKERDAGLVLGEREEGAKDLEQGEVLCGHQRLRVEVALPGRPLLPGARSILLIIYWLFKSLRQLTFSPKKKPTNKSDLDDPADLLRLGPGEGSRARRLLPTGSWAPAPGRPDPRGGAAGPEEPAGHPGRKLRGKGCIDRRSN